MVAQTPPHRRHEVAGHRREVCGDLPCRFLDLPALTLGQREARGRRLLVIASLFHEGQVSLDPPVYPGTTTPLGIAESASSGALSLLGLSGAVGADQFRFAL